MIYLNKPVAYLTDTDIDTMGKLVNSVPQSKPVFIMIQSNFCGYCTMSKPDFQKAANALSNKVFFATIQGDGKEPGEPVSSSKFKMITNGAFAGFPSYALYKDGIWINYEGGRDSDSILKFLKNNI